MPQLSASDIIYELPQQGSFAGWYNGKYFTSCDNTVSVSTWSIRSLKDRGIAPGYVGELLAGSF